MKLAKTCKPFDKLRTRTFENVQKYSKTFENIRRMIENLTQRHQDTKSEDRSQKSEVNYLPRKGTKKLATDFTDYTGFLVSLVFSASTALKASFRHRDLPSSTPFR